MKGATLGKSYSAVPDGRVFLTNFGSYQSKVRILSGAKEARAIVCAVLDKLGYCFSMDTSGGFVSYITSHNHNVATKAVIEILEITEHVTEVRISGALAGGSRLMSFFCKKVVADLSTAITSHSVGVVRQ